MSQETFLVPTSDIKIKLVLYSWGGSKLEEWISIKVPLLTVKLDVLKPES